MEDLQSPAVPRFVLDSERHYFEPRVCPKREGSRTSEKQNALARDAFEIAGAVYGASTVWIIRNFEASGTRDDVTGLMGCTQFISMSTATERCSRLTDTRMRDRPFQPMSIPSTPARAPA